MQRNHLNDKDVNGNIMAWMANQHRDEGERHVDKYFCDKCQMEVVERNWIASAKCCVICWMDK